MKKRLTVTDGKFTLTFLDELEYNEQLKSITDDIFSWLHAQIGLGQIEIPK